MNNLWRYLLTCRIHYLRRMAFRKLNIYLDDQATDWRRLYVNSDKTWGFK